MTLNVAMGYVHVEMNRRTKYQQHQGPVAIIDRPCCVCQDDSIARSVSCRSLSSIR
jgi:hypothetical protein